MTQDTLINIKKVVNNLDKNNLKENISSIYQEKYNFEKSFEHQNKKTTHQLITESAIRVLKKTGFGINIKDASLLIDESSGPDKNISNMLLMMEGHFYGDNHTSELGNFIPEYFNKSEIKILKLSHNDIDENAKTNFIKYINSYTKTKNINDLSWALHYLQDTTAPHHIHNMPAILTGASDTHHSFEKYANKRFCNHPTQFDAKSLANFNKIEKDNTFNTSEEIFYFTYNSALLFDDYKYKKNNIKGWKDVIDNALPFAIAMTMVCISQFYTQILSLPV